MKVDRFHYFGLLTASVLGLLLSACSSDEPDDVIWDIAPQCFEIEIVDQGGNIIGQESQECTYVLENTSIEYDGKVYTPKNEADLYEAYTTKPQSRYYMPHFKGLYYNNYGGGATLHFGEFAGDEDYTLEFKIHWPDGTSADVRFKNKFRWKNKKPKKDNKLWIDGKEQNSTRVIQHRLTN